MAVNQAYPLPPLRPPANQIQTSLLCPSWDWSHGMKWQETKRRRTHPTRSWIATRQVAWTPGLGLLWAVNTPSGRVIAGHRGTFSSWGESWILTRLRETEHFIGDFKRLCLDCCRKLLIDIDDVPRDDYWEKLWERVEEVSVHFERER